MLFCNLIRSCIVKIKTDLSNKTLKRRYINLYVFNKIGSKYKESGLFTIKEKPDSFL